MALHRRPAECAWSKQISMDLSAPLTADPVDLEGAYLAAFSVLELSGEASATLDGGNALELEEGETRAGFDADTLTITSPGNGGTLVLELHGRF